MTDSYWLGAISAIWLGILTSVSPCPLATNIAAVTYIGRQVGSPSRVVSSGFAYAAGRMVSYAAMGMILATSIASASGISNLLQAYASKILGPLLILVGMVLLELLPLRLPTFGAGRWHERAAGGTCGAAGLGLVFALSFCPVSAALFFGSLIPLSIRQHSPIAYPLFYGLGTGIPVLVFGVALGVGAGWVAHALHRLTQIERWTRYSTGAVFIAVGIYLALVYIFGIL
jgi:cytochrome c-type biogenesis protein